MQEAMYNMGAASFWVILAVIALVCINKIRKNRAEIKRLEKELEKQDKK
ncbi:MAG: hypothetical protein IJ362_09425 [Oscillospiraceae bacterium]|nr:hypothetical protein [Oscillospiraceae bacterium]